MSTDFNLYGISFIFILLLKNKKLPLIFNISEVKKLFNELMILILKNENQKDQKNIKDYEKICLNLVDLLKDKLIFEKNDELKNEFVKAKIGNDILEKYF